MDERTGGRCGETGGDRRIIDISAPLSEEVAPWPGDEPVRLESTARIADGASVNLRRLSTSLHNGTHADAPLHVREGGHGAADLPLAPFMGPAVVLEAPDALGSGGPERPRSVPRGHRVLLRWGRRDHRSFPEEVPPVPPAWIRRLTERDVPLLGTDLPSVDAVDSRELPAHHACVEGGIQVLENLVLEHVEPGRYELRALPLRLERGDASPVRAVLVEPLTGPEHGGERRSRDEPADETEELE